MPGSRRCLATEAAAVPETVEANEMPAPQYHRDAPSPPPSAALTSAKLAALHARLALSKKIPLQTLARALVTPSADKDPRFNNGNLALLGSSIISYHTLEYIMCRWPRLPLSIVYSALSAFAGPESLAHVAKRWGVEEAAAPGKEVDAGLLQWSTRSTQLVDSKWAHVRAEASRNQIYRRGMSSRVVLDDAFGEESGRSLEFATEEERYPFFQEAAYSSLVQAIVGAIYAHCGREPAKAFVTSHILTRQLDLSSLFQFKMPTKELAMLCAREGFEPPIARLESETGRHSRTPVFIVGIYSGKDKLGEGAGASLDFARRKASMNALKAWYLYSPGAKVRVPSDMMDEDAEPWTPPHIDVGEIV